MGKPVGVELPVAPNDSQAKELLMAHVETIGEQLKAVNRQLSMEAVSGDDSEKRGGRR